MRRQRIELSETESTVLHRLFSHVNCHGRSVTRDMNLAVQVIDIPGGYLALTGRNYFLWSTFHRWWPNHIWHRYMVLSTNLWSFRFDRQRQYDKYPPFEGSEEDFRRDLILLPMFIDGLCEDLSR